MMIASLRQWFYPKEFRIAGSGVSLKNLDLNQEIKSFEDTIQKMVEDSQVDTGFVKDIATSVWRLEKRMQYIADHSRVSRVATALNMMKDILNNQKIQIEDYTGKAWGPPYDGIPFDEVGGDPTGNIMMVEPRIFYEGKILQKGKVVINKEDSNEG